MKKLLMFVLSLLSWFIGGSLLVIVGDMYVQFAHPGGMDFSLFSWRSILFAFPDMIFLFATFALYSFPLDISPSPKLTGTLMLVSGILLSWTYFHGLAPGQSTYVHGWGCLFSVGFGIAGLMQEREPEQKPTGFNLVGVWVISILMLGVIVGGFALSQSKTVGDGTTAQKLENRQEKPYYGELGPYFTGKEYHYVGTFYEHNFSYILENEGGALSNALAENHKVANIWTAHEAIVLIVQQNSTKKLAIIDPFSPETAGLTFDKIKFQDALQGSDLAQAWARASSPESFSKDRKKGRTHNWVFIESGPTPTGIRQVYVGDEINTNSEFNCRAVPMLEVIQTNYMLFLDPKNSKFAPVKTDVFGVPTEEMKYRDIAPGGVAEAVLKAISTKSVRP